MINKTAFNQIVGSLHDIWDVFSDEEKQIFIENFKIANFKKNEVIYSEGDTPEYMWILLQGKVKKYKNGIGDRPQILRLYKPVQYFGYRAYFADEKYLSTAMAFEPAVLGCIHLDIVNELLRNNSRLGLFFIHELAHNLGGSDTKIVNLTQKHIRGRLAEALLFLGQSYGFEDDGQTLRIYLSREDLANLSNMTASNAIRTLASFAAEKLITVDGRRIKIIDELQLKKISHFG